MKKIIVLFSTLFVLSFVFVPAQVFASCPWYDPFCVTPTPIPSFTPTPTPNFLYLAPTFKVVMPLSTATPTPTNSPTPTATLTPSPTETVAPQATATPEVVATPEASITEAPVPTVTPAQLQTLVMGFTLKEMAFAVVAVVLLLVLIVQSNWAKIKSWLHDRTS